MVNNFTVTFNPNGANGVGNKIQLVFAQGTALPDDASVDEINFVKTGFSFTGWYNAASGGTQITTTQNTNHEVYARWVRNSYLVKYNRNYGTYNSTNTTNYNINYESALHTNFTRVGHTFAGWYDNSAGSGSAVTTVPANPIELYAKWTVNNYWMTFWDNSPTDNSNEPLPTISPTPTSTDSLAYGSTLPGPDSIGTTFSRQGYRFVRWVENANPSVTVTTVPAYSINLRAIWHKQFTVTFTPGSRPGNNVSLVLDYASSLPNYNDSRIDYDRDLESFAGWFESTRFTTVPWQDITLIAHWSNGARRTGPTWRNLIH